MKTTGLDAILGKTITGVVVKTPGNERSGVQMQMHLVFSDGTCFEIYSTSGPFSFASAPDRGGIEEARRYLCPPLEIAYEVVLDDDEEILPKPF